MRAKVKKTSDITKKNHLLAIQLLNMKFPNAVERRVNRKTQTKRTHSDNCEFLFALRHEGKVLEKSAPVICTNTNYIHTTTYMHSVEYCTR